MNFDNELRMKISQIEVPDELSPENIEAMLLEMGVSSVDDDSVDTVVRKKNITVNRWVVMRTVTAAAACLALAVGVWAYGDAADTETIELEDEIEYEAVKSVDTYDELYSIYTGIYLRNSDGNAAAYGDGVEITDSETASTETETAAESQESGTAAETTATVSEIETEPEIVPESTEADTDADAAAIAGLADADIIASYNGCTYYISSNTLYVVSQDDMTVLSRTELSQSAAEMYCQGGYLVIISAENVSDEASLRSESNVVVDIYDISSAAVGVPKHIKTYKQNGELTSIRMSEEGVLYLVTVYSDYRTEPLNENISVESFVPGYYIDGEKYFIAPSDIIVPTSANSTDYTVVSSINCGESGSVSVKAVLGSCISAYAAEDMLYIAGMGIEDGVGYTTITSFELSADGIAYSTNGSVEGNLISKSSISEWDGCLCVATFAGTDSEKAVTVYVLDRSLNVVKSTGQLLAGSDVAAVVFEDGYASIYTSDSAEPEMVIDLSQEELSQSAETASYYAPYTNRFSDSLMVGITAVYNDDGDAQALKLEMYSTDSGELVDDITFAEYSGVASSALTDRKAMLVDEESGIIGIPVSSVNEFAVKNQYYVFTYNDESGFIENGVIEFNDLDFSFAFERAVIEGDTAYLFGSGRAVSVRLSDMSVLQVYEFE
ncbi:MAG: beta-propeller domain-containing protein [Oscillospiraceae bacterium]|nr:beta-propeller domain-containing protein [Oscillospiraceae bacterium]